ncbi:MAG: hypothetical protein WB766_02190 [Roseiarcus sp.]
MTFVERSGEFETIGQHNDGLRAALAFNHRKPDRLGPVREQAGARASGVLNDPMPASIVLLVGRQPNEQFRRQSESERDHQQQP